MIEKLAPTFDAPLAGDPPSSTAGAASAEGAIDFSALLGLAAVTSGETPSPEAAPVALPIALPRPGGTGLAAVPAEGAVIEPAVLPDAPIPAADMTVLEQVSAGPRTPAVKPLTYAEPSPVDLMARIAAWLAPKGATEQAPAEQPADAEIADVPVAAEPMVPPVAQPVAAPIALPPVAATPAPAATGEPSPLRRSPAPGAAIAAPPAPEGPAEIALPQAPLEAQAQAQPLPAETPASPFVLADAPSGRAAAVDMSGTSAEPTAAAQPQHSDMDGPQPVAFAAGAPPAIMNPAPEAAVAAPVESVALEDLLIADAADGAWLDRLASDIRMLADGEHREAHLKLTPRMLGDMDIRLDLDGRNARVHFTVETAAAQTLIADGASRLATLVEANGLKLDGTTVDLGQGRRDERQAPAEQAEPYQTQSRAPRAAPPELARAVARTRIAAGYERYA